MAKQSLAGQYGDIPQHIINRKYEQTCLPMDDTNQVNNYMQQMIPQIRGAANHDVTHVCVVPQILCATNHDVTHARQIMTSGM